MFKQIKLDYDTNLFQRLSETTQFEDVAKGRTGAVLVKDKEESLVSSTVPLVRTTTKYKQPTQKIQ